MDIRVRKEITINKAFNKQSDTGRLYLPRNRGGKGLICIQDFCERMCVSTQGYVLQSKTIQGREQEKECLHPWVKVDQAGRDSLCIIVNVVKNIWTFWFVHRIFCAASLERFVWKYGRNSSK